MNKEFMSEFYDRFYEDCIFEAVGGSSKMGELRKRRTEAESHLKSESLEAEI